LLDTWIHKSHHLNYEEIDVNNHCQQLKRLSEDIDEQDRIKLNKLCILLNPIDDDEFLANYLDLDNNNIERYSFFIDRLITVGIFDSKSDWFKHELIKSCFKGGIRDIIKKKYHKEVANHYYSLMEKKMGITLLNLITITFITNYNMVMLIIFIMQANTVIHSNIIKKLLRWLLIWEI